MQDKKSILIASLSTLFALAAIFSNMLSGIAPGRIFIYLGGAIFYLLLVLLQKTGQRDRVDSIHTGELAVLSLLLVPLFLHTDNWILLLLAMIPAALTLTWIARNILDPLSSELFHTGILINGIAALLFLALVYRWEMSPVIIMNILTGALQARGMTLPGFIILYILLVAVAVSISLLFPRFRLLTQGRAFYSSHLTDYHQVNLSSLILESMLLVLTLLTIGILGSSVHWLIRNREHPLHVINTFLLIVITTQLFLFFSEHQAGILLIGLSLILSYSFFRLHKRKVYLW